MGERYLIEWGINMLSQEEVFKKFENLVKYAAKQVSSTSDMSYCGMDSQDLYQEGMMLLYKCWLNYQNKPMEEFKAIFSTSLFRGLKKMVNKPAFITVDLEEVYDLGYTENTLEEMYMEFGMKNLAELLKEDYIALAILHELIEPSERTIWEMKMDTFRKEQVRKQGCKVNVNNQAKVKMLHIKRALDITQKQFDEGIYRLRQLAKQVFEEETSMYLAF